MAGVEKFKVTVTGVSSHAARPDLGVDTVTAVTTMVQNVQLLISRTVSPFETAVCPLRTWMWAQLGMCSQNQAILKGPFVPLIQVCKET